MAASRARTTSGKKTSKKKATGDQGIGSRSAHISIAGQDAAPRRLPRQARARETVTAILQAAARIIVQDGYDRASTNRIARLAGVSIGSLYQYFPNKAAILAGLYDKHHRQVGKVIDRFLDRLDDRQVPLDTAMRRLFVELVAVHREDPDLSRALSKETPHPSRPGRSGEEEIMNRVAAALGRRPEVRVRDLRITTLLLGEAIGALSRWLVHDAPDDIDVDLFIDESIAMLAGYALGDRTGLQN